MKHTINYEQTSTAAKYAAAIQDCKSYLSDNFDTVINAILSVVNSTDISDDDKENIIAFHLSFVGIQGMPVLALIEYAKSL